MPKTGQDQRKLGRSTAVALTPCQGNPSALSQAENAFLPTHFPGSTDPLFDSRFFLLTLWRLSSPEHRHSGSSKGLFRVMWGRTMSHVPCPLLLAGAQP